MLTTSAHSITKAPTQKVAYVVFPTPLEIQAGSVINVHTRTPNPEVRANIVSLLIELDM